MTRPDHGELLAALADGVRALAASPQWRRYLDYQSCFRRYSPNNVLLIAAQCPAAREVASFNTWRRLGRQVRRGERAIWILAPVLARSAPEPESDPVVRGFRPVPVFDISQTEGAAPPSVCAALSGAADDRAFSGLAAVARAHGFAVREHEFCGRAHGECDFAQRTIRIESTNPHAQRVKTLAHELAHALLHENADNRAEAELEAESVAYVVCRQLALDSGEYSFGYVTAWAGGGEEALAALRRSASRIQRTAGTILDGLEAAQAVSPSPSRLTVSGEKAGTHTDR